ncbi:MAG: sulfatase-like hydrolase/transferase [Tunicatimonas sp.]
MIRLILLTLLSGAAFLANAQTDTLPPPNILWIVSEDNSPFIGAYGDTFAITPNIDRLATEGVLYENAFASAPVCAPARSTLITGMYANSLGTQHMRSANAIPDFVKFFPRYLREAGYYCTNNAKKDYNTNGQEDTWNESSRKATYQKRPDGKPFFSIFNFTTSHESSIHESINRLVHNPEEVPIPPYHPRTEEMKHDWAQYYDQVTMMDAQVGKVLQDLEARGLADNTIVFYYSDHGGILGRSKRFLYESGLRVPLVVRFPEKYAHLAPGAPGTRTDRVVSFVDFAPTVLSLAGVTVPDYMQGSAFLGEQEAAPSEYAFAFRGRMDEAYDMARSVRDKRFRYTRNYMPHRIYGQYLQYLWRAPSMASWQAAYEAGELNEAQSAFWESKPPEELYDVTTDPHNVRNLSDDPQYQADLERLRGAEAAWVRRIRDAGFLPEAEMMARAQEQGTTIYEMMRPRGLPLERIIETAELASSSNPENLNELIIRISDEEAAVRYWAATGCAILGNQAKLAQPALKTHLEDPSSSVAVACAEALYYLGETDGPVSTLTRVLEDGNEMARVHAVNVLKLMGEDARPALEAAQRILDQSKPENETHNRGYDIRAARSLINDLNEPGK